MYIYHRVFIQIYTTCSITKLFLIKLIEIKVSSILGKKNLKVPENSHSYFRHAPSDKNEIFFIVL